MTFFRTLCYRPCMSRPSLFDTHVHLDHEAFAPALAQELAAAREAGVRDFVVPGVRAEGWAELLALCKAHPGLHPAPGLHPMAAGDWSRETASKLEALLALPEVVAVGEVGLDFHPGMPERDIQLRAFREQLELARAAEKPVLIHCRRGWGELMGILKQHRALEFGGILHGFSSGIEIARQALDMGFVMGIGAAATWPGARRIPELLEKLPPESIVLETDAPDQSPHPFRAEPGRPSRLPLILEAVSRQLGLDCETSARMTTDNARRVLRMRTARTT